MGGELSISYPVSNHHYLASSILVQKLGQSVLRDGFAMVKIIEEDIGNVTADGLPA